MAEVQRFEEKVQEALRAVMKHAVAGHDKNGTSYTAFCNDGEHALAILRDAGITPMNTAIVERYLDSGIS
jgi:non-ribosomal peptide synthetase component E (peptide arylation enzyme)